METVVYSVTSVVGPGRPKGFATVGRAPVAPVFAAAFVSADMGVQPPANDSSDEPEAIEFGIAAVDARLDAADVTFPATRADLVAALDAEVPYDAKGRSIPIADAIDETGRREFDSEGDLLDALHPVFEERCSSPASLLDQVRALLPF